MDAETKQMFISLAEILRETTQAALSGRNQSERTLALCSIAQYTAIKNRIHLLMPTI